MTVCEGCGTDSDRCFTVITDVGRRHIFDTVQCAAHVLAPACMTCGVRVLGHGVGDETHLFCSAHCARAAGVVGVVDRVSSGS